MKLKSDYFVGLFWLLIIILEIVVSFCSCSKDSPPPTDEYEYYEEVETYEEHVDSCYGDCEHVENEIQERIYDDELIDPDDIYDVEGVYTEDDLERVYWEGAYDGYIQGYGDCYYGKEQEQELDEYVDEDMF